MLCPCETIAVCQISALVGLAFASALGGLFIAFLKKRHKILFIIAFEEQNVTARANSERRKRWLMDAIIVVLILAIVILFILVDILKTTCH